MNAIVALIIAAVALMALYAWAAIRYRRKAVRLVEEWQEYRLEHEDGPDGIVAGVAEVDLVDLDLAWRDRLEDFHA